MAATTPPYGGGPYASLGLMGQEGRHGLRRGRQRAYAALGAPGAEYLEVRSGGPPRGRSFLSTGVFGGSCYLPSGEWQRLTSGHRSGNAGLLVVGLGVNFGEHTFVAIPSAPDRVRPIPKEEPGQERPDRGKRY